MQVFIETTSGLERRLTVGVPSEKVESEINTRLQKAAKTVRLDGFRPGKVPMRVLRQRFGAGVRQEVVGEVMSQSFYEAITQENLRPAGQPSIEPKTMEEGKDLEFVATFEVFPEIELQDMAGFAVEKPAAEVTDSDVDDMIAVFRKQQGGWEDVSRAAKEGDQVNIDYAGTRDGEPFDGGSAEASDLELGSNRMIPGFESGIEGLSAGDEKVLSLSFPDDYHSEDLKGAAVEFKVKVNAVQEHKLAELDEELFKQYGVEDGGEEQFRKEIGDNMRRELDNALKATVKKQVMDAVLESHSGQEIPKALIASEVDTMRQQMFQQFGGAGATPDLDLQSLLPAEMFEEQATRRVKLGLVLHELIQRDEIKADAEKVRAHIEEMAATYQDPEEVINWYYSNQEQLSSVEAMVLEEEVVDKLLETASVSEQECSYKDAMAKAQEANAQNQGL
ncbi:trigger factor [Halieaceae bacterium IMCC14734]|uniref:Trigger factor n=1 Tax=Candidatus Litorirhabdus singularis TaxID=2518993 RepID=A0ABT3TGD0_9GAMM|nr:trigger factor [Candidatus Litorirhabdus singularis]MCX2981368.1 trigger factor [Candidatus Litorirhabdus singularis]